MLRAALHVCSVQLLAGILHFDGGFARHGRRTLADQFGDLAHRGQLFGALDGLVAIFAADAAAGLLTRLLRFVAGALALRLLPIFLIAVLPLLRIGLIGGALLAVLRILLLALLLLPLALLRILIGGSVAAGWMDSACCGFIFESRFSAKSFILLNRLPLSPELLLFCLPSDCCFGSPLLSPCEAWPCWPLSC